MMPASGQNISDYLLANCLPDDTALTDAEENITYRQLRTDAGILAGELAELGLPSGARVAIVGQNSRFWVAGYLAILKLGLVAVPLSHKLSPQDLARNANLVECSAALIDSQEIRRYGAALGTQVPTITEQALTADRKPYWPQQSTCDPDADAVLMFTSGTTSLPRAVRVTHRNIQANTESILQMLQLRASDRVLVILPFFYCFGASLLHTHLRVGARLVLCNSSVFPETVLNLVEREKCTVFAGVPSSFHLLLRSNAFGKRQLSSLRMIQQAGGALPKVLADELRAAQPHADLFTMYGQTEATARLSILPPEVLALRPGSIGRGIPGVELRVLDDQGRPVPPGIQGEIYARGSSISPGYFRDPEGSVARFTPRGLRTGDLAVVDQDGYIFIVDRRDDFIKSWGHRVSSQEIESVAAGLEGLTSVAAVGLPDYHAGEAITLFATVRPGSALTPADVLSYCGKRLPRHMVPRSVQLIESMPMNSNGKIVKRQLKELAGQGQ
jgi:long-chain acyl-CoA synthetase